MVVTITVHSASELPEKFSRQPQVRRMSPCTLNIVKCDSASEPSDMCEV